MKKKIILSVIAVIQVCATCSCGINNSQTMIGETSVFQTVKQSEETTSISPEYTTTNTISLIYTETIKNIYDEKAGIISDESNFDESLFWNVGSTENAGFIIPVERYSTNWELYQIAEELIDKSRMYNSTLSMNVKFENEPASSDYEAFYPVEPNSVFGSTTMRELYNYYSSIFYDTESYEEYCDFWKNSYKDIDGVLCMNYGHSQGFMGGDFLLWDNRSIILYDETETTAEIMIAIPEEIKDEESLIEEWDTIYYFDSKSLSKDENGWRISH